MEKEIVVHCNLYLKLTEGQSIEDALDSVLMMIDPDLEINVFDYELRDR